MNWINISRKVCVILCGATVALGSASADTVTVIPVADAEIHQFTPDFNYGGDPSMVSGALGLTVNREIRRAVLRFDLASQVPAGATINSVTLQVRVTRIPSGAVNSTFDLRRLLQPWTESGVTWNSRSPSDLWETPGAIGESDVSGTVGSRVPVMGLGLYTFQSTPDLKADVQAWVNNPATNFGWLLISENETTPKTARHFATREGGSSAPVLTIDYSLLPVITAQPQSQTVTEGDFVTFSVVASGGAPLTYQWQFNNTDLPGVTNAAFVLANVSTNDGGVYTVIVRNANGSAASDPASLTVLPLSESLPRVSIASPTNGARFPVHADVLVNAEATATNALIAKVEFFSGTNSIGVTTNSPFSLVLSNLSAGIYLLIAQATDDRGRSNTSTSVTISVHDPPAVSIAKPAEGSTFPLGTNVTLEATIGAGSARLTKVEFFEGNTRIVKLGAAPFRFEWLPAEARLYTITAAATDEFGQTGVSAPVTIRVCVPDSRKPGVVIGSSPLNFARLTNSTISLTGTASDDIGVDHVVVFVNGAPPFLRAIGTTNWTAQVPLFAGVNKVLVFAVDQCGNISLPATRFFTFVVHSPLDLQTNGLGTVAPNLSGRPLEIGRVYSLTARPGANQIFAGWDAVSGSNRVTLARSNSAPLNFVMQSNLTLTANFIPNPFPAVKGTYTGLFSDTNNVTPESSGFFRLQVGGRGAFSGRLVVNGTAFRVSGQLNHLGQAQFPVLRRGKAPVALTLNLDLTNGTDQVLGSVTSVRGDGNGSWVSDLRGDRNVFNAVSNPTRMAGGYTFALETLATRPVVVGTTTATIGGGGGANFVGTLSDGRRFNLWSALAKNGDAPFYLSLSRGAEVMIGQLNFTPVVIPYAAPAPNVGPAYYPWRLFGDLQWVKAGTNGFSVPLRAISRMNWRGPILLEPAGP